MCVCNKSDRLDRKNQEKSRAYARLKQIRDEEEKLDADIETFKNELTEFKRFIHEESLKVEVSIVCVCVYDDDDWPGVGSVRIGGRSLY